MIGHKTGPIYRSPFFLTTLNDFEIFYWVGIKLGRRVWVLIDYQWRGESNMVKSNAESISSHRVDGLSSNNSSWRQGTKSRFLLFYALPLSLEKNCCACIVTPQLHGFVGSWSKKRAQTYHCTSPVKSHYTYYLPIPKLWLVLYLPCIITPVIIES